MVSMAERPSGGKRHVCGKPRPQCLCWSYLIVIFEAQAGGAEELVGEGEKHLPGDLPSSLPQKMNLPQRTQQRDPC